jgi:hypothetical protein
MAGTARSRRASSVNAQLIVCVPGRPFSLNAERTQHWSDRAERTKELRWAAKVALLQVSGVPRGRIMFDAVGIEVRPWALNRRYRQDVGNCYASFKAVLDGFVDAHLIKDDDDAHLRWVVFYPHQFGVDQMEIRIHRIEAETPVTWINEARQRLHPVGSGRG